MAIVAFLAFFLIIHYCHFVLLRVDVVLYAALLDCLLAAGLVAILIFFSPLRQALSSTEISLLLLLLISWGYIFSITIPTIVDRSLSVYILEKLNQRGGAIKQDAFPSIFKEEYLVEHRLVDVRLTEQLKSGTIKLEKGCVKLTDRGMRIVSFTEFYRKHFLPSERLLLGEYTDALKSPLGNVKKTKQYVCD